MKGDLRVLFICTGLGIINRGIESFFREAFDGLKKSEDVEIRLLNQSKTPEENEKNIWCLSRESKVTEIIGKLTGRTPYAVEQWSSFPAVIREIKSFKPDVVFSSEANLFFLLYRFRKSIGVPFKLLFSNGGPIGPPFNRTDFVHQVAPYYQSMSIKAGESENKHIMVPYGINVPDGDFIISPEEKNALRTSLGLPKNRLVVISVGWISAGHKRMDYTIKEVASIPIERRPFLLLLGNIDQASAEIFSFAKQFLRPEDYLISSVSYPEVANFYKASDIFVLSSLLEGFGRVYLEALTYNLPVIAHQHPVMQYVIGEEGMLDNLEVKGNLAAAIVSMSLRIDNSRNRREYVRKKFDWKVLAPNYIEMFQRVAYAKSK